MITFEQDEFNLADYQFLENQFPNDFRVGKKRRYDNKEPPQEMSKQQLQQVTGRISEEVAKKYTIKSPTRKCTFKLTFERDPVYIAGRYCKYSRCLPQSPWSEDKDAPRKPGNSVSEKVCDILKKTFEASDSRFVTSGREDIDVRMLGTGRPFVVELRNCRKTDPVRSLNYLKTLESVEETINQCKEIKVNFLTRLQRDVAEKLSVGEEDKRKPILRVLLQYPASFRRAIRKSNDQQFHSK
uniref:tRNA pseudouridine(55) synthase n=1 Tax=Caenorhabditis japonica TaxID=281687 RepID=A0A8R1HM87_CAEJA